MDSRKPSFVYGFHGTDRDTALRIVTQQDDFQHSRNSYDWLGAVIDLGNCLDLLDQKNLNLLKIAYDELVMSLKDQGKQLPENIGFEKDDFDFRKRELDCAVIRMLQQMAKADECKFDTVRAAFWEGAPLYPGAGFHSKNHIQISVLNVNCIKGVFLPREMSNKDSE